MQIQPYEAISSRETLLFLHLPKCAGTTFNQLLAKNYPQDNFFISQVVRKHLGDRWWEFDSSEREKLTFEILMAKGFNEKTKLKLVAGHMNFGWHQELPQPSTYITILREPGARIVSLYRYLHSMPRHYQTRHIEKEQMSVLEFMRSGISISTDNEMTRRISGIGAKVPFGECTPQHLQMAKENLRTMFAAVGIAERFDETLLLMKKRLGWKRLPLYLKENISVRGPKNIPFHEMEAIRSFNALDCELYSFCVSRFDDEMRSAFGDPAEELKQFQAANLNYQTRSFACLNQKATNFIKEVKREVINQLRRSAKS